MRNLTRFSTVLTACLAIAACGDDGDDGGNDTTTTTTTTATTDATGTTDDTSNPSDTDTVVANPCEENPCTNPPAATCDGNSVVTYAATGTCTAGEGSAFTCDYAETTTACTGTDVCAGGACIAAGDLCEYEFDDKVSYVTHIAVGNQSTATPKEDACCFDFNGDVNGEVDNKLGTILGSVASLASGFDINGTIEEQITDGSLVLLLETKGVDSTTTDDDVDIAGFYGEDADGNLDGNAAGNGSFIVNPSSFIENTATPLISFPDGEIAGGVLTAGPSVFRLSVPVAGAQLDLAVTNTRIEGVVSTGGNGTGLKIDGGAEEPLGAKLGGVIKKIDLINALNAYTSTCDCLAFTGGATELITVDGNLASCNYDQTNSSCTDEDGACGQIGQFCGVLLGFLSPDVDVDGDGCPRAAPPACPAGSVSIEDGISVGVWIKAESAAIQSVDTCPAP